MTYYFYDPVTFEYAGSIAASGRPGALPPDNSTSEAPKAPAGTAAFWSGDGWEYVVDHRGERAYATDLSGSLTIVGVGSVPDGYTLTPPPKLRQGYVVEWDGERWKYTEDHRGAVGYVNGVEFTVTDLGPLPEGWSTEAPPPPEPPPYVPPPDTRTPEEKRRAAYHREADPIVQQIDGYEREAEALRTLGEEEKALAADAKAKERLLAFLAKKDEIRARYPDE